MFFKNLKDANFNKNFNKSQQNKAFTIAEILITLGIIGVVASITIPILQKNVMDYQFKQAWKKEFAQVSQAYSEIVADNAGSIKGSFPHFGWGPDSLNMINLFKNKIKITQYCPTTSDTEFLCWHPYGTVHDKLGNAFSFSGNSYPAMILSDGSLIKVYEASSIGGTAGVNNLFGFMAIDVNGKKGPNTIGRDIFRIEIQEKKLAPEGAASTLYWEPNKKDCATIGSSCAAEFLYK